MRDTILVGSSSWDWMTQRNNYLAKCWLLDVSAIFVVMTYFTVFGIAPVSIASFFDHKKNWSVLFIKYFTLLNVYYLSKKWWRHLTVVFSETRICVNKYNIVDSFYLNTHFASFLIGAVKVSGGHWRTAILCIDSWHSSVSMSQRLKEVSEALLV